MTQLEQKIEFAQQYVRRPDDALMIAAKIIGATSSNNADLAMEAITAADSWPNDPIVLAEITRIKNVQPSKREYILEIHENAKKCLKIGEAPTYHKLMELVLKAEGYVGGGEAKENDKRGEDKLKELAAMIIDETDLGDD